MSAIIIFINIISIIILTVECFLLVQVLHCKCCVDTMTFPVTVTEQSPAAVSMDTYQITIAPMVTKVQKHTWIIAYLWALTESQPVSEH